MDYALYIVLGTRFNDYNTELQCTLGAEYE